MPEFSVRIRQTGIGKFLEVNLTHDYEDIIATDEGFVSLEEKVACTVYEALSAAMHEHDIQKCLKFISLLGTQNYKDMESIRAAMSE